MSTSTWGMFDPEVDTGVGAIAGKHPGGPESIVDFDPSVAIVSNVKYLVTHPSDPNWTGKVRMNVSFNVSAIAPFGSWAEAENTLDGPGLRRNVGGGPEYTVYAYEASGFEKKVFAYILYWDEFGGVQAVDVNDNTSSSYGTSFSTYQSVRVNDLIVVDCTAMSGSQIHLDTASSSMTTVSWLLQLKP